MQPSYPMTASYGATQGQERFSDTANAAMKIGAAAIGAPGTASAVSALLVAAGASNAAPVAGQVVAVGAVVAAGVVALVGAVRSTKIRRGMAVQLATELGLPDPSGMPAFITRVLKLPADKRQNLRARLANKVQNKDWWETKRGHERRKRKLATVAAVELAQRAQARGTLPQADTTAMDTEYASWFAPGTISFQAAVGGTVLLLGLGTYKALR